VTLANQAGSTFTRAGSQFRVHSEVCRSILHFLFFSALFFASAILVTPYAKADSVQYIYDAVGRLIAVIDTASDTTEYTYDAAGNLQSVTRHASSQLSIISIAP
jgi:YD repeat-containing protein